MIDPLVLAFERAAGRGAGIEPVAPALAAFADRVVHLGRQIAALPPVPAAVLARAMDAFQAPRSRAVAAALWRLVFDSWQGVAGREVAAAMRGGSHPRFLRFGGRGGQLELEMVVAEEHGVRLRGTVDGPSGPLVLEIAPASGPRVRVPVRAGGAFAATLPSSAGAFTVAVRSGRGTLSRTGRIPPISGR